MKNNMTATTPTSGAADLRAEVAMIDAAMVEMTNITPPLKRSECARLLRAALAAGQATAAQQGVVEALSGVQELTAAPAIGDELRDTLVAVSAAIAERDDRTAQKMIREILAASPTPPAEQQAIAPETEFPVSEHGVAITTESGAVYAELPQPDSWFHFTPQYWGNKLRDFADATHALRASHGQAPAGESLRTDALCDLSYSNGLKAGWNYCASDDLAGFERAQKIGTEALRTLKSATAQPAPAAVAGCTRSHPHENMDSACRAKAAIAEMRSKAARGAEATAHDLDRFVVMLTSAPTTRPSPAAQGDALESEYQRGYRQGYEQRDAEVRGALV